MGKNNSGKNIGDIYKEIYENEYRIRKEQYDEVQDTQLSKLHSAEGGTYKKSGIVRRKTCKANKSKKISKGKINKYYRGGNRNRNKLIYTSSGKLDMRYKVNKLFYYYGIK